jgi:hypothetical protein
MPLLFPPYSYVRLLLVLRSVILCDSLTVATCHASTPRHLDTFLILARPAMIGHRLEHIVERAERFDEGVHFAYRRQRKAPCRRKHGYRRILHRFRPRLEATFREDKAGVRVNPDEFLDKKLRYLYYCLLWGVSLRLPIPECLSGMSKASNTYCRQISNESLIAIKV